MKKEIKGSKRGLTFSFKGSGNFAPGEHFRYIIEPEECRITILPSSDGGNTVSKKRSGFLVRSLIDIRTREIKEMVSEASKLEIEIENDLIVVRIIKNQIRAKAVSLNSWKRDEEEICIPRTLLKAAGGSCIPHGSKI